MTHTTNRIVWLIAALLSAIPARADSNAGPQSWSQPTTAPTLHGTLPEEEYAKQLAAVQARIKPGEIAADMPWAGVLVQSVDPKGQARSLGIKRGDVIVASNNVQVFDYYDWMAHRDANDDAATVWSPATGRSDVRVKPGLLGVNLGFYFRPEVRYLRELRPGQDPDPLLFAAATCAEDNPELARAILTRLQKAGNTDRYIYFLDAIAASAQCNFDDAVSSGMWALHLGSDIQRHILAPLIHSAALASFHLTLAEQIEHDYPFTKITDIDPDTHKDAAVELTKTINQCNALTWTGPPSCVDAFAVLNASDDTPNMVNAGVGGAGGIGAAAAIRRSRHTPFDAPDSQYNLYVLGPPGNNVQLSTRCRFSLNKNDPDGYTTPCVKFGVSRKGNDRMLISMMLFGDGQVEIAGTHIPDFSYHTAGIFTTGKPFEVTLTVVGNRCEIDVAGVRAYYGPILEKEAKRQLCMVFQAVGVKGQLNQLTWKTAAAVQ